MQLDGKIDSVDRKTESLPDKYFDAYREANLRFPQRSLGIVTLTASAALSDPEFNPQNFAQAGWSRTQLDEITRDMNRAHGARGIPVGSADALKELKEKADVLHGDQKHFEARIIPDENLQRLWNLFKGDILGAIGAVSGITYSKSEDIPSMTSHHRSTIGARLKQTLADPNTRQRARDIFRSFEQTLRSPEASATAKTIRDELMIGRMEKVHGLYRDLRAQMIGDYEKKGGILSPEERYTLETYLSK